AARRDTLMLEAPALGLVAVTDGGADRSARQDIGNWVWRALSASWSPPAAAWTAGAERDSAWSVSWVEDGDTLQLAGPSTGRPRTARAHANGGASIDLVAGRGAAWDGIPWPGRVVVSDGSGRFRVTLQPQALHLKPSQSAERALRRPPGAARLSRSKLMALLERLALEAGADSTDVEGQ